MTQTNFEKLITTQKGNLGEQIIKRFLEEKGFVVYKPITEDKPHLIDGLATLTKDNLIIAFDVKAKARMNKYHATGINKKHFDRYYSISKNHSMQVFIFFVDEKLRKIYGGWLSNLIKPHIDSVDRVRYPYILNTCDGENIILFSLEQMRDIAELNEENVKQLNDLSARTYEFQPITGGKL